MIKVFLLLAAAGLGFGQTGSTVATPVRAYVVLANGGIQFVALDPTRLAIVNGVLTVIAPAAPALPTRIVEITQVAVQTPTYTLGQTANATSPELDVFWNGIVLAVGVDYTVAGSVVTFINGVLPGPSDVLRVVYRTA